MDFRNLILFRLCAYEVCRAADPNQQHYCFLVSSASPRNNTSRAASTSGATRRPTQR